MGRGGGQVWVFAMKPADLKPHTNLWFLLVFGLVSGCCNFSWENSKVIDKYKERPTCVSPSLSND